MLHEVRIAYPVIRFYTYMHIHTYLHYKCIHFMYSTMIYLSFLHLFFMILPHKLGVTQLICPVAHQLHSHTFSF